MKIPDRPHYPQENNYSWLPILLDAYAICDEGLRQEIATEVERRGMAAACSQGCDTCCRQQDIPVSTPEFMGMVWYVTEVLVDDIRDELLKSLGPPGVTAQCPFLKAGSCSIYPARPLACREFVVYRQVCAKGEDPHFTRPADMHPAHPDRRLQTALRFLDSPVYNLPTKRKKIAAYNKGVMHKFIPNMHEIDWRILIDLAEFTGQALQAEHEGLGEPASSPPPAASP